ncbi:MAG TPA: PAS domain S-box protein [Methanotrichaceae archaeon]|nr:PAS domain S-box protein [Methanotrichaceae archaeon]
MVESAKDAMEKLKSAFYDVVVSEYAMDGMDGIAFLKKVRVRDPEIPFVLLIDAGEEVAIVEALKDGAEYSLRGRDGSVIFADLSHRIRTAVGGRRVWAALLELDERYWALLQSLPGMSFTSSLDFVPTSIRGNVEEISGYTEEEIFSCDPRWDQIIHPDDFPRLRREIETARSASAHISENEYRIVRKGGGVRWVHELVQTICEVPGVPVKVEGVLYDVTARKRAESALEHIESRYQELADLLPQTVFEIDLGGQITLFNQKGLDFFGYSSGDLKRGLSFFDIIAPDDPNGLEECFRFALRGGCPGQELLMKRKDGSTFPALVHCVPIIQDGRPSGLRGIVEDVS